MVAHRVEALVSKDGTVTLQGLPFADGERVEVIVLPAAEPRTTSTDLVGSVKRYERPFEAATEWETDAS